MKLISRPYITFSVRGYNPVGDAVGSKSLRGVGPIEPGETASYHFEDVIYSRVMSRGKIESIKIQYMDGSVKTLTGINVTNCIWTDSDKRRLEKNMKAIREFDDFD